MIVNYDKFNFNGKFIESVGWVLTQQRNTNE